MNTPDRAFRGMRPFHLIRRHDPTGISGTGCVAEGVVFSSGWVAMTWLSRMPSITFYSSIDQIELIHGHEGTTKLVFEAHACSLNATAVLDAATLALSGDAG